SLPGRAAPRGRSCAGDGEAPGAARRALARGCPLESRADAGGYVALPARYICPEGAGRPPAGSRVTAKTSARVAPGKGSTRSDPSPLGSTAKMPALIGLPSLITQSWYVLPAGRAGSPLAVNTPARRSPFHHMRPRAAGLRARPSRATAPASGAPR